MTAAVLLVVVPGLLIPVVLWVFGLRVVSWLFVALFPLYMYHKSMIAVLELGTRELQWPTLTKDVVALALLALFLLGILYARDDSLPRAHRRALAILAAFGAYWLLTGLATGNGMGQTIMGVRVYAFFPLLGLCLGAVILRRAESWESLAWVLFGGSLAIAVVAFVQAYVADQFLIHPALRQRWAGYIVEWYTYERRLRGFFTSANTLGFFMGSGMIAGVWLLLRRPARLATFLTIPAIGLFAWILVLTLSRTALVGALASVLVLVHVSLRRVRSQVVVGTAVAALLIGVVGFTPFAERFATVPQNPRFIIWAQYLYATLTDPVATLIGHGVGAVGRYGTEVVYGGIRVEEVAEMIGGGGRIFALDNFYIRSFYETGLLGFAFLFWAAHLCWRGYRHARAAETDARRRRLLAFPVALMVFILMISLLTDSFGTYPWNLFYWLSASGLFFLVPRGESPETGAEAVP